MKITRGERVYAVFNTIILSIVVVLTIYPALYVFFGSLSDSLSLMKHRGLLLYPRGLTFAAYEKLLNYRLLLTGYRNTILYTTVGTMVNMVLTAFGAYALTREKLRIKKIIIFLIIVTMYFRPGIIPEYLLVRKLGLFNTMGAVIFPVAINSYYLIIMMTGFRAVPKSLEEAATMDGANDFFILFRIIIPLSIPVMAALGLFYVVVHWNMYFLALIYLKSRALWTLQLVLNEILIANTVTKTDSVVLETVSELASMYTLKYAAIVVTIIPVLLVYPFIQKYFTKGILIGSVKG